MAAPGKPKPRKITVEFTGTPAQARLVTSVLHNTATFVDSKATIETEGFDTKVPHQKGDLLHV